MKLQERFEYPRQLILEACDGSKVAAEILNYLLSCFRIQYRKHQNDPLESSHFTFCHSASHIASKTFYRSIKTISRGLAILKSRGLIFVEQKAKSLDRRLSYRINFVRLELWRNNKETPLFSQMSTCIETSSPHASGQNDHMHEDNLTQCIRSECPHVYSIKDTSNTHRRSMAVPPFSLENMNTKKRLVTEAGFSEQLAETTLQAYGDGLVSLALDELKTRKTPASDPFTFVRGFISNPVNYNATEGEQGWEMAERPVSQKKKAIVEEAKRRILRRREKGGNTNDIFSELCGEMRGNDDAIRQAFRELDRVRA